jgi:2-polyprenyl-6-methoxyphenol hydroxylase-like FAD-dependent oxidoreductase
MNTGLVDAVALGGILADVLSGRQPEAWLDRYGALRRPAAQRVLSLAGRLTAMAVTRSAPQRALRNAALSVMDAVPPLKDRLAMNLSGLARRDLAA